MPQGPGSLVQTPEHSDDTNFAIAVWVQGAPLLADAVGPGIDAADPSAARIIRCSNKRNAIVNMGGGPALLLMARAGTSVVLQPWFYDYTLLAWVKFGGTSTITVGTSNVAVVITRNLAGAKFYVQVVTVTGAVTEVGYDFV